MMECIHSHTSNGKTRQTLPAHLSPSFLPLKFSSLYPFLAFTFTLPYIPHTFVTQKMFFSQSVSHSVKEDEQVCQSHAALTPSPRILILVSRIYEFKGQSCTARNYILRSCGRMRVSGCTRSHNTTHPFVFCTVHKHVYRVIVNEKCMIQKKNMNTSTYEKKNSEG